MIQELDFRNILGGEVTYLENIVTRLQKSGTIFGALYCKKDGSLTQINGRFGVSKFLRGGKRTAPDTMLVVWDNNRKRYTSIDPERIISMRVQRKEYINFSYKS